MRREMGQEDRETSDNYDWQDLFVRRWASHTGGEEQGVAAMTAPDWCIP